MLLQIGSSTDSGLWKNVGCTIFSVTLLACIGVGVYLIVLSEKDEHGQQVNDIDKVIESWSNTTYPLFSSYNISVTGSNGTYPMMRTDLKDWTSIAEDLEAYEGLVFTSNEGIFSDSDLKMFNNFTDPRMYERRGSFTFNISNGPWLNQVEDVVVMSKKANHLTQKMCNMHKMGCWDHIAHKCYYHYSITKLCVVVNETSGTLVEGYSKGCDNNRMEVLEPFKWKNCSAEPEFKALATEFHVRALNDPYVYAANSSLDSLSPTPKKLLIVGIVAIVGSALLFFVPVMFFCQKPTSSSLLYKSKVEMNNA